MKNKKLLVLILILTGVTPVFLAFAARRPSCCRLQSDITIDDIEVCGPPIGQPPGCDPESTTCCVEQSTWIFNGGQNVGPIGAGVTQCWVGSSQVNIDIPTPRFQMVCILNSIYKITDWVFWFALALSIIIGIVTGFFFFTAGGEPYKIEKAKKMLVWLIAGTTVAVLAKVLTALIIAIAV